MTGGWGALGYYQNSETNYAVEVLRVDGTAWCNLPDLPDEREEHTQSGLLTCGGYSSDDNCVRFSEGHWNISHEDLNRKNRHSAWSSSKHGTIIIGFDTAEYLADNGTTPDSFSLVNLTL